ncbi:MAG: metallophosphoesterase [Arcobacteraceae bacterium]|nr:metallophosphoesterase [Arcobacteraceae bacterium]
MKIDILSDLHLDHYFKPNNTVQDAVTSIYTPIFTDNNKTRPGDVLIIAGDIGHYNSQNLEVLKIFQNKYYKYIICVLGNHEYYLINEDQKQTYNLNSFNKVKEMRELINSQDNMYCLDGNVVEIEGIKFGGCDSWYDDAYMKEYYNTVTDDYINQEWKKYSNDSRYIHGIENYNDIRKIELPKIKNVYKDCDIMITHVNPSFKHKHINSAYHNNQANTFFTSNCYEFLKDGNMKYWIFGHAHDVIEFDLYDVKCICNPMGYPAESEYGDWIWIKSIEV